MFASELTPIFRSGLFDLKISHRAISDYLSYWYICEPNTIFENVFQLPPGHYGIVRAGQMRQHCYWQMPVDQEIDISFPEAAEKLLHLLKDAVNLRTKVEVPIGTFLSGGIDSGLITALAARCIPARLKSFSIGFKEKSYSELDEANETAKRNGVDVISSCIDTLNPDTLETIFRSLDEPLGNASFVPTYFLAKMAREHVKVVLTGDGGDELFGGYPTYQAPYYLKMYGWLPSPLTAVARRAVEALPVSHNRISLDYRLKQLMKGISLPYERAHFTWREVTPLSLQGPLFRSEIWEELTTHDPFSVADSYFRMSGALSVKNQLMFVDMNTYLLNDHLRKVDRMTMANSLEARVPFLDHRVVEFAMSLPSKHKVTFLQTKKILKHIARNYLPDRIIRGKKKGLTAPIGAWILSELREYTTDKLTTQSGILGDFFDPRVIRRLLEEHATRESDNSRILWSLLTLQVWGENFKRESFPVNAEGL